MNLATTTPAAEGVASPSSPAGGEGWGEEADFIGCPSPRPFLAGRGSRYLVVASKCALSSFDMLDSNSFTPLIAGPLSLRFDTGDLRYITLREREVVRRIYVAVR